MTRQKRARITTSAPLSAALLLLVALLTIVLTGCDLFPADPPPPPPDWTPDANIDATPLIEGVWAKGDIPSSDEEQWFKFTATTSTSNGQYIHVIFGTLEDLSVQLYDNKGETVGNSGYLRSNTRSLSRTVTSDKTYYIRVKPYTYSGRGTYQIAFNTSSTRPDGTWTPGADIVVTPLTEGVWADGNITSPGGKQWFSFTATTSSTGGQYIHVVFGTLTGLYVRIWDSFGDPDYTSSLSGSSRYISRTLKLGEMYHIEVEPYSSPESGDYKITFSRSSTPPVTWPPVNVTPLTESVWADGNIATSGGEQWFSFTATTSTANGQYIHITFGTLTDLNVQLYDNDGKTVGSDSNLYTFSSTPAYDHISRTVTSGQIYYVRIKPRSNYQSGNYQIAFSPSSTPPVWVPPPDAIPLTESVWTDGDIVTTGGEQWFSFTATASSHYIHITFGTLTDLYVQLYDSDGRMAGSRIRMYGSTRYTSRSVTSGRTYYIKVSPYSSAGSGIYQIAFNRSSSPSTIITWPPTSPVTSLPTANQWVSGIIAARNGGQWFSFTTTASSHYIHVTFGTLNDFYVQLYDSNGNTVGDQTEMWSSNRSASRTVTSGQTYYIRVTPHPTYGSGSGTYHIAFNTSTTPPTGP